MAFEHPFGTPQKQEAARHRASGVANPFNLSNTPHQTKCPGLEMADWYLCHLTRCKSALVHQECAPLKKQHLSEPYIHLFTTKTPPRDSAARERYDTSHGICAGLDGGGAGGTGADQGAAESLEVRGRRRR